MMATFGFDAERCDSMFDAEFWGYAQHLDRVEQRKANHLAMALAPLFGLKMGR